MGVWGKVKIYVEGVKKRGKGVGKCRGCGKVCWGEGRCGKRHEGCGEGKGRSGDVKKCMGECGECGKMSWGVGEVRERYGGCRG